MTATASQHAQHQDLEAEVAKWNSAIIHLIIYTCAFPTVTCQNVFSSCIYTQAWLCAFVGNAPHSQIELPRLVD